MNFPIVDATILYRGSKNHTKFYPISSLYFSPGVDQPSQLIPSIPSLTIEEIESYYCPQCLENFPSSEAMQYRGRCPRGECFTCAECGSCAPPTKPNALPESTTTTNDCYFRCKFCHWNSIPNTLTSESSTTLITKALNQEQGNEIQHVQKLSQLLETSLQNQEKQLELYKRLSGRSTASVRSAILLSLATLEYGKGMHQNGRWVVKDIEAKIAQHIEKESKSFLHHSTESAKPIESSESTEIMNSNVNTMDNETKTTAVSTTNAVSLNLEQQLQHQQQQQLQQLQQPLRCKLRTKRSLRCRTTFENGHPGILLKSHINPLTGDSSMRAHMGKWYKKSSFARSCVPRLAVKRCSIMNEQNEQIEQNEQNEQNEQEENKTQETKESSVNDGTDLSKNAMLTVEITVTNPTDMNLSVSFFPIPVSNLNTSIHSITNNVAASASASSSSSSVIVCNTTNALMTESFQLERYDELAEQDWSDEVSTATEKNDPSAIVDRVRNKVVVSIPLIWTQNKKKILNLMNTGTKNIIIFPIGITTKTIDEKEGDLDISYECLVSMSTE